MLLERVAVLVEVANLMLALAADDILLLRPSVRKWLGVWGGAGGGRANSAARAAKSKHRKFVGWGRASRKLGSLKSIE